MRTGAISLFHTVLMVVLIVLWGSSFVIVKTAFREGLTPIAIATFRFLIAGGLFAVALVCRRWREPDYQLRVERRDQLLLLILALTGVTLFFTTQYVGIQMAGPSIAAIFVCLLSPILITILSAWIFRENLSKAQILGVGLAGVGTFIVITGGALSFMDDVEGIREFLAGSLILLVTPVLWTTYSLLGKRMMEKYDSFLIVSYVAMLGGLGLIPFSLAENSFYHLFSMSVNSWLAVLFLSIACSLLGYSIWFYVLKHAGAAVTSSFLFAEPLVTVLLAAVFVGEELGFSVFGGGFLIFLGVFAVTKRS